MRSQVWRPSKANGRETGTQQFKTQGNLVEETEQPELTIGLDIADSFNETITGQLSLAVPDTELQR